MCATSKQMTDADIKNFKIPERLLELAPFDIIIVDGPEGFHPKKPGRLIPCYWSTLLSRSGTIIYVDDARRQLESYFIQKFFRTKVNKMFSERNGCAKIIF
jgi:hypothetical protein